jgi:stalled ribosome rescue protein Dom34
MHHFHAIIWLDHREAKIYEFNADGMERFVIRADSEATHHIHHKAGSIGSGHTVDDQHYFGAIAKALALVGEALVVGPGSAKSALMQYLATHDPRTAAKVVGVESADHPTDGEVVAFARKYFKAKDHTLAQRSS